MCHTNAQKEAQEKVQRARGIAICPEKLTPVAYGTNPNIRYYNIPNCSNEIPKVRLHDNVLNIQSKTGNEEVPPRRDERSQNLSQRSSVKNVIRNFEEDILELQSRTIKKCSSIFASDVDQM